VSGLVEAAFTWKELCLNTIFTWSRFVNYDCSSLMALTSFAASF
jgi:hypothetical protein